MARAAASLVTLACLLVFVALFFSGVKPAHAGQVLTLPGYSGPKLSMFTGYITVNQEAGQALFYWMIESESSPSTDPVVFWFQGGPGCSSLLGLFEENGPLRILPNGSVVYTDLSWTQYANMVWVESPAGVGFSYSDQKPFTINDTSAAADNYAFIQSFFDFYTQFQGRDFWITGESYGGVYVPMLTNLIVSNQSSPLYDQLKGIMVGNGLIDCESLWGPSNQVTAVQFNLLYWHGLVSYTHYSNWTSNQCDQTPAQRTCTKIYNDAVDEIGIIYQELETEEEQETKTKPLPSLDPDNLYQDFCTGNGTLQFTVNDPNDCQPSGNTLVDYLNEASVQSAIEAIPTTWSVCSSTLTYDALGQSMIPYYQSIFEQKPSLNVLIYSGDVDIMTVPFAYTQFCLAELNDTVAKNWQPWYVNGWTAGYVEVFNQFTFATLKGSGHEAPEYQPLNALNLFSRFLQNGTLDETESERVQRLKAIVKNPFSSMYRREDSILTQGQMLRSLGIRR